MFLLLSELCKLAIQTHFHFYNSLGKSSQNIIIKTFPEYDNGSIQML